MSKYCIALISCFCILLLCGCSDGDERNHPLFRKGESAQYEGNGEEAVMHFKNLLKRRPGSVYTHLHLANIYDELLNDPLLAVMHYRLYLEAAPDTSDAEEVKAWLLQAEKRCFAEFQKRFASESPAATSVSEVPTETPPAAPTDVQPDTPTENIAADQPQKTASAETETTVPAADNPSDNAAEIAELRKKIKQYAVRHRLMMDELVRLRKIISQAADTANTNSLPALAAGENMTYTVAPGDTPGSIARKIYGRSSLASRIMQANPGLDARKLRPGMKLIIPPKQ